MSDDRPPRGPAALSTLQDVAPEGHTEGVYATTQPGGTSTPTHDTIVPAGMHELATIVLPESGYQMGAMIGQGGMGEIIAAHDQRIGRDVAIKRMRGGRGDSTSLARFLREARIQARLEHPAIVPVHELGTDAEGRPFFTMKKLAAVTLNDKLAQGGPVQPLLRAFIDVCMAVEFAHTRGVVHRDLKPANIMVGDFNEVYVIDWGVARVLAERASAANRNDIETLDDGSTMTAGLLGTPGYMSPEQIDGGEVITATDVYALGAILFEILAGEPLHPRGRAAIASTIEEPQEAPARRRPERAIAPELDSACFDALAKEPATRPTARDLADRVQAYLDGDRDLERRRNLAVDQLALAREALESSAPDGRAIAMRRAGRALALDPDSTDAAELVTRMLVEAPRVLPPGLATSLDDEDRKESSARSRTGVWGYLSIFGFLLALPLMTVSSWPWLIALNIVIVTLIGFTLQASRKGQVNVVAALVVNLVLAVVWTRIASPFMLTPILVCGVASALAANPKFHQRGLLIAWAVTAMTLPILLEAVGVLEPTWVLDKGVFMIRSVIFASPGMIDGIALVAANTVFVLVVVIYAISVNQNAYAAKRTLHIKEWHMRQMLPNMPGSWTTQAGTKA